MYLAAALALFLFCSFFLALPKYKGRVTGFLSGLLRIAALIVGSLSALLILGSSSEGVNRLFLWQGPESLLRYASVLVTLMLGACALSLLAHSWQTLLIKQTDIGAQAGLSAFKPDGYLHKRSLRRSTSDDAASDLLFLLILAVVGALFWVGLKLSALIARFLLPAASTTRAGRALLSFIDGMIVFGLIIAGLSAIFGLNPIQGSNLDDAMQMGMAETAQFQ